MNQTELKNCFTYYCTCTLQMDRLVYTEEGIGTYFELLYLCTTTTATNTTTITATTTTTTILDYYYNCYNYYY